MDPPVNPSIGDTVEGTGYVTMLEPGFPRGAIDGTYFFNKTDAWPEIMKGSKVEFSAKFNTDSMLWAVTSIKLFVSPEDREKEHRRKFLSVIGKVIRIEEGFAFVKYGKSYDNDIQMVPVACLPTDYIVWRGDYLRLKLELNDVQDENSGGKIHSVEPTNKKTLVGHMRLSKGRLCIDNYIHYDQSVCFNGRNPKVHDCVLVVAVESQQGQFTWRAVSVRPSSFQVYAAQDDGSETWLTQSSCWSESLKELIRDRSGIRIQPEKLIAFPNVNIGSSVSRAVELLNCSSQPVTLENVIVKGDQSVCKFEVTKSPQQNGDGAAITNAVIMPHKRLQVIMLGSTRELIIFDFGQFQIGRHLTVTALSPEVALLDMVSVKDGPMRSRDGDAMMSRMVEDVNRPVVRGIQPIRAPFFMQKRLDDNPVPRYLWNIREDEDDGELARRHPGVIEDLRIQNYLDKFRTALWLEEMENHVIRRQYDMTNVVMRRAGEYLAFEVPGLKDISPPIQIGEPIGATDTSDPTGMRYEAYIYEIRGEDVYVKFNEQFRASYQCTPVTIQFFQGRTPFKRCHYAIEQAVRHLGEDWLFPDEHIECKPARIPFIETDSGQDEEVGRKLENGQSTSAVFKQKRTITDKGSRFTGRTLDRRATSLKCPFQSDTQGPSGETLTLTWFNKMLNQEQKDAVRRILRGQGRPLPYIVFGPPGTGKTVTICEAILQVNKLDKNSRVLVVAPSNSAADVITMNLVSSAQFVAGDFVRLVGFLRLESQIPESIRDFCIDGEFLDAVARHRLIVTTCTSAGQFFQLGLDTGHFTHVFIDEAGYCTEPEALIGASLVALDKSGQVILAGDPKQLGPVLMSDPAVQCGLSISHLERLMTLPLYSRNERKFPLEKYNPLVLTKLVKNYRAHPTLLKLPSKLFYEDELEPAAAEETVNLCHSVDFLKDRGTPLLFHGIQGTCTRDPDSPSWFNAVEVIQVVDYVRLFRKHGVPSENIGIITPYRKQVEKLRRTLELGLLTDDIPKVGSVEEFQGGEREVMIMSLVRSAQQKDLEKVADRLSFVFSPKRFNVAVTRAKAVLVVVGNPHVLVLDPIWQTFLKYCIELGCYTGCNLPTSLEEGQMCTGAHFLNANLDDWGTMEQEPQSPTVPKSNLRLTPLAGTTSTSSLRKVTFDEDVKNNCFDFSGIALEYFDELD